MKKNNFRILVVMIFALILVGCQSPTPPTEPADTDQTAPTVSETLTLRDRLLTNITLTVPGTEELISFSGDEGEWSQGYVLIGELVAQLPNGAVTAILEVNSGGNARDVYLAVFEPGEASWQLTDTTMLGESASNAEVMSLTTDAETIRVSFLTYGDDMAAQASPKTQENEMVLLYLNSSLSELMQ